MSKFCSKCGTVLPDTALVCSNCGTPIQSQNAQSTQPVQPNYYAPQPQQQLVPVTTIKQFLGYMWFPTLLSLVTCGLGGLILTIVWACSKSNPVRKNYACALLINMLIILGIYIVLFIILMIAGVSLSEAFSNSYSYY